MGTLPIVHTLTTNPRLSNRCAKDRVPVSLNFIETGARVVDRLPLCMFCFRPHKAISLRVFESLTPVVDGMMPICLLLRRSISLRTHLNHSRTIALSGKLRGKSRKQESTGNILRRAFAHSACWVLRLPASMEFSQPRSSFFKPPVGRIAPHASVQATKLTVLAWGEWTDQDACW